MRDLNGLELSVSGINGVVHTKQTMLLEKTQEIHFEDEISLDTLFSTVHRQYIAPNTRCIVQIALRYSWDSDVCPDFKIVVTTGNTSMISAEGLDDYPDTVNTANMSIIVLDTANMRIKLTKTAIDITKFKLYAHSFIKIDVI